MSRNPNRPTRTAVALSLLFAYGGCASQESHEELRGDHVSDLEAPIGDLESHLYPPALVLDHQAALTLTETQRLAILEVVSATQTQLVELDANLRRDTESLRALLDADDIDEAAAVRAAERVMTWENQIKSAQLRMLIRIKNQLTSAQRASLDQLR